MAVIIGRYTAHVVVHGGQHGDRLNRGVDAGENFGRFGNTRQTFVQDIRVKMFQMQVDMVVLGPDPTAFADFDGHRAADDITGC